MCVLRGNKLIWNRFNLIFMSGRERHCNSNKRQGRDIAIINLLIALPISSQLPYGVTQYIKGNDRQSPKKRTAKEINFDSRTWLMHPTSIRGILSLKSIKDDIRNGEKRVTKWRVQDGSNELMLAMLPVPKKHSNVYNIYNEASRKCK